MSKIHQIQFQFLPVEDRLVLKMSTTDKEEFSFVLTRRFVSLLYPILTNILHADKSVNFYHDNNTGLDIQHNNRVRQQVIKLQQQEAIKNTDTHSPYQNSALTHPLGNKPILLANISTNTDDGQLKLSLTPEKGQGVSFAIDQNLTHLLRNLLLESLRKTDWHLDFQSDYTASTARLNQSIKKVLH